jgi:microcystin-dependent protein
MGGSAAGRIANSNVTSGGGDTPTTPAATGGEANHALTVAELAAHNHTITDPGHNHTTFGNVTNLTAGASAQAVPASASGAGNQSPGTTTNVTNITINNNGSGTAHNTMAPFVLGTWYLKL